MNHAAADTSVQAHSEIYASLNYSVADGAKPITYMRPAGAGPARRGGQFRARQVPIVDGRAYAHAISLEREGFELTRFDSLVTNFYDDDEVRARYYPQVEVLVESLTGASRVLVFDHNVRYDDATENDARGAREPVRTVHNDYTERSGPRRVRDLLGPQDAERALLGRVAIINVWKPIKGPVRTTPLAVADAQSIAPGDLIATDLRYQHRVGEVYHVAYNPRHQWYYFSDMQPDEALLIKCYDSAVDGRARFTAHTAFDHPAAPSDAAPRESIEARTLAFFS